MAQFYPSLDRIRQFKVQPTAGEWRLLNFLRDTLDDTFEIYFNPYLNGDRPDVIIMREKIKGYTLKVLCISLLGYIGFGIVISLIGLIILIAEISSGATIEHETILGIFLIIIPFYLSFAIMMSRVNDKDWWFIKYLSYKHKKI